MWVQRCTTLPKNQEKQFEGFVFFCTV